MDQEYHSWARHCSPRLITLFPSLLCKGEDRKYKAHVGSLQLIRPLPLHWSLGPSEPELIFPTGEDRGYSGGDT